MNTEDRSKNDSSTAAFIAAMQSKRLSKAVWVSRANVIILLIGWLLLGFVGLVIDRPLGIIAILAGIASSVWFLHRVTGLAKHARECAIIAIDSARILKKPTFYYMLDGKPIVTSNNPWGSAVIKCGADIQLFKTGHIKLFFVVDGRCPTRVITYGYESFARA